MRPIEVTCDIRASAENASAVLSGAMPMIVSGARHAHDGTGTYRSDLHVDSRHGSLHHEVNVTVAPTDDTSRWRVSIEPVGSERALPSFDGTLAVDDVDKRTRLVLAGHYEPPLGRAGAFGDGVLGHRLVCQSLQRFVTECGERLDAEADRLVPAGGKPAPYPPDLRRAHIAENWLG